MLAPLNNISFNHVFLIIKENDHSGCTLLYAKQYSSSPQWEPEGGCQFLLNMPSTFVYGARQMPIETKKFVTSVLADNQKDVWMQALQDKRRHIDNAKKYAGEQDTSWWDVFFKDQEQMVDNFVIGN